MDDEYASSDTARDQWFSRSPGEIDDERQLAERAGREAYAEAIRTGKAVRARTPDELVQLGRMRLAQQAPSNHAGTSAQDCSRFQDTLMQVDAFGRAAANKATFGLADHLAAAGDAVGPGGDLDQLWRQYQSNLHDQRARDAYDAVHRTAAHELGAQAGEVLSFIAGAKVGAGWSGRLSSAEKGKLGEALSVGKTIGRGDLPKGFFELPKPLQRPERVEGGRTIVDHATGRLDELVESKFGPRARLRVRQREARQKFGPRYRVDRWGPQHVGLGTGSATAAASVASDDDGSP